MYRILFSAFLVTIGLVGIAQKDINLHFLNNIVQANKTNPAFMPKAGVVLGFYTPPSMGFDAQNSFSLSEAFKKVGDSLQYDFDGLISKVNPKNNSFAFKYDIELLRVASDVGKEKQAMITLSIAEKINFHMDYPKSFFELLSANTTKQNLNLDLSDMNIALNHYREYTIGFAKEFSPYLTAGVAAKILFGKGNISSEKTDISLVSNSSNIIGNNNSLIRTSGMANYQITKLEAMAFNTKNPGYGFDIGATYKIHDDLKISASVIDIGTKITWKDELVNYLADSTYTYNGVDFKPADPNSPNNSLDTLLGVFKFNKEPSNTEYTTKIPAKIFLSGEYKLLEKTTLGALVYLELENVTRTAFSVCAKQHISHVLSASVSYSVFNNTYGNLGLGFVVNGGPFQFFLTTDNILSLNLPEAQNINIRFGSAFQFGRTDKPIKE